MSAQTGTSPRSAFSDAGSLKRATEGLFPSQKLASATDEGNLFSREVVNSTSRDTQYDAAVFLKNASQSTEHTDHKAITEHKDHKAITEHTDHKAITEHKDHKAITEHKDHKAITEHKDHKAITERTDHKAITEHTEHKAMHQTLMVLTHTLPCASESR